MENSKAPLLKEPGKPEGKPEKTPRQKVVRKTFKGTARLSNHLPTGSVLTFQFLSPIVTNEGKCRSKASQGATAAVLAFCAVTCFVLNFTDSFRDERGKVRYGVATFRGLWVVDGSGGLAAEEAAKYRVTFVDFVHAFLSIVIFAVVAMSDQNVAGCFFPSPSVGEMVMMTMLPMMVGAVCSIFFVVYPTTRHGVGFPLSKE
ncbi:protein DMP7-like [Salvia hispanica]|uniref:protein DMP7-like n=1 Tax=Salvia hispanica TaxID=49212 RepID=UPI0020091706|nr:protein DMP7-like [Salvia hispanica]